MKLERKEHDASLPVFTKTQVMQAIARGVAEETFTHESGLVFNVTAMRKLAISEKRVVRQTHLTASLVRLIYQNRDVDDARVDTLSHMDMLTDPSMFVLFPYGEHLLIDGTHRILRRRKEGLTMLPMWLFNLDEAILVKPDDNALAVQWGSFEMEAPSGIR